MNFRQIVPVLGLIVALSYLFTVTPGPAHAIKGDLSGNVSVTSKYIFRGAVEDANGAVQGGLDWAGPDGWYAGYWTSSLDYGNSGGAVENDLYAGYTGEFDNGISYDVGALAYLYTNEDVADATSDTNAGESSDAADAYVSFSKGPWSVGAAYALEDATWTNEGDIYYHGSYSTDLSYGFSASVKAGYYSYDADPGDNLAGGDDGFSDAVVSLSHPIGETGATMSLNYHQIGDDRVDDGLGTNREGGAADDQQVSVSVSYGFDIKKGMDKM